MRFQKIIAGLFVILEVGLVPQGSSFAQNQPSPSKVEITPGKSSHVSQGANILDDPEIEQQPPPETQQEMSYSSNLIAPEEPSNTGTMHLSIGDCVQMALLNNREIKAQDFGIQAAEWKLKQAQARGIPVLEYEFISAPAPRNVDDAVKSFFEGDLTFFQKGKVGMGIPLYSFGKLKIAQELARAGIDSEKEKKTEKQNDVVLKVQKLYYGWLLAQDLLDVLRDANRHMESEIARRESEQQTSDPIELVRLKLFRYEIVNRIEEAEKKSFLAKEGLRIQMGLERGTPFEISDEHLRPVEYELKDFETYLEMSRKYRPEINLLNIGVNAAEAKHRLEKRGITPDIGFGGFYEFGRTTNDIVGLALTDDFNNPFNYNRVGFGLRVKGDINIKKYQSNLHEAQAEYFKAATGKQVATEGLELDLKDSYLDVYQSKKKMENSYKAMKLARQFVFLTKTNLDIGVGDKKDYSDALQAYLVARGRYLESVFNYNVAVATLKQKVGGVAQQNQH